MIHRRCACRVRTGPQTRDMIIVVCACRCAKIGVESKLLLFYVWCVNLVDCDDDAAEANTYNWMRMFTYAVRARSCYSMRAYILCLYVAVWSIFVVVVFDSVLQFFFCCCCLFARWMSFLHGSSFYHFICYCLLILLQFGPNSVQSINSNNNTMVKICIISPGPLTHVRNTFSRWRSISTMAGRTHNILALLLFFFLSTSLTLPEYTRCALCTRR